MGLAPFAPWKEGRKEGKPALPLVLLVMELNLLLLLLLIDSLWSCSGRPADRLVVTPQQPVVPYGGSTQLNCSLACVGGMVQWRGLDTNLGSITSFPTHSILHISSAVVATAGTRICQGTCHGQLYQQAVGLEVYAIPARLQLQAEPRALVPGKPGSLRCSAQGLYPLRGLQLTWYQGDHLLQEGNIDASETEEELFDIESTLPLAGEEVREGLEFRCTLTLTVGQETFTRVASLVAGAGAVTEPVATVTNPQPAVATRGSPRAARPNSTAALPPEPRVPTHAPRTAPSTPPWDLDAETTLQAAAATKPPSAGHPATGDPVAGSPSAGLATTTTFPSTTSPTAEGLGTAGDSVNPGSDTMGQKTGPSVPALSEGSSSTDPALPVGTTVSLLGLVVAGAVSRRLWKRLRTQYQLP